MKRTLLAAAAATFFVMGVSAALADPILGPDTEGVMSRPRPDYDAKGLPLGGFRLFPSLDLNVGYDDNVHRQDTPLDKGSLFYEEVPSIRLQSDWSRHELDLYANMDAIQYTTLSDDSQTNYTFGGDGRLDITRGSDLAGGGSYSELHEARNSPDEPGNALKPTDYHLSQGNVVAEYHPYNFGIQLGGSVQRYAYDATQLIGGGLLSNRDRDEDLYDVYSKLSYEFSPGYAMFVRGDYDDRTYDLSVDRNGYHRASHGYLVNGGVDMMLTHLLRGELFVGYLDQSYRAPLKDVSGLDYGANLDYYATGFLTLHLTASRTVNDTTIAGASASNDQLVGLSADYELLRNLIVQANASYHDSKYNPDIRDDKYTDLGLGVKYLINRYFSAHLRYTYEHRDSTVTGANYNDNIISIGLTGHL
jgi:hypothetical protein